MTFQEAKAWCHVRSAIYRTSKPDARYNKNHNIPLEDRISIEDQEANDWEEYDPADDHAPYYRLA